MLIPARFSTNGAQIRVSGKPLAKPVPGVAMAQMIGVQSPAPAGCGLRAAGSLSGTPDPAKTRQIQGRLQRRLLPSRPFAVRPSGLSREQLKLSALSLPGLSRDLDGWPAASAILGLIEK